MLRDAVVTGLLQPGTVLRDDRIAGWLTCSRESARGAIAGLVADGLAVTTADRQTIVVPLTKAGARDLVRVYRLLAVSGYEWAAPNVGKADVAEMRRALESFAAAVKADYLDGCNAATTRFNEVVLRRAGSPQLLELVHSFSHRADRLTRLQFPMAFSEESVAVHAGIVEALSRHDHLRAIDLYCSGWDRFEEAIEAVPGDQWGAEDGTASAISPRVPGERPDLRPPPVEARLRDAIVRGALPPGGRLDERRLALWLDVDPGEVRRALAALADEGVLTVDQRGSVVTPLTNRDALDLLRVIRLLMVTGYEWACARLTSADIAALWVAQREFAAAVDARDHGEGSEAMARLQMVVMERSGSPELASLVEACRTRGQRLIVLQFQSGFTPQGVAAMASMVGALQRGDLVAALDVLQGMWAAFETLLDGASGEASGLVQDSL